MFEAPKAVVKLTAYHSIAITLGIPILTDIRYMQLVSNNIAA